MESATEEPIRVSVELNSLCRKISLGRCKCSPVDSPMREEYEDRPREIASPPLRKAVAEFIGTFIMVFSAVIGSILDRKFNNVQSLIGNATCVGLAVLISVISTGHISGAHFNPSVTIAFATYRKFPWVQVPAYFAAQFSASLTASFILKGVFGSFVRAGATVPSVTTWQAFVLEAIITFSLMFVIFAVATDTRAVREMAGIGIGGVVMLNILVAGVLTGASMNPARTLGPAIAAGEYQGLWIYFVAPTLGALAGAGAYSFVKLRADEVDLPRQVRGL